MFQLNPVKIFPSDHIGWAVGGIGYPLHPTAVFHWGELVEANRQQLITRARNSHPDRA